MPAEQGSAHGTGGDEAFDRFVRRRANLNERLDSSRQAIDAWLQNNAQPFSMTQLANLEGLLNTRRNMLSELVALDDEFMVYLIELQNRSR